MAKIIPFPNLKEKLKAREDMEKEYLESMVDECVELSRHIIDVLEFEVEESQGGYILDGFDLRNPEHPEAKDAYVIANLMCSMFMRYIGVDHRLQGDLNSLHNKIMRMQKENDDIT